MNTKLVDITYTVKRNGMNHFFFIEDQLLNQLELPIGIKDEIASFGASPNTDTWPHSSIQLAVLQRLSSLFKKHWDLTFGLPRFRFSGDTEKLGDELKHRTLLLFISFNDSVENNVIGMYQEALSFCSKVVFQSSNFMSTDHRAINTYLRQCQYDKQVAQIKKMSTDFTLRMRNWYPDTEHYDKLMTAANTAIETFITVKQLNLFIPNFLVVPVYHIRRYQKALSLITEAYTPNFIMTLPIEVNGKSYTILFPISYKNIKR